MNNIGDPALRAPNKIPLAALHRLAVPLVLSATVRLAIGILLDALIKNAKTVMKSLSNDNSIFDKNVYNLTN